MKKDIEFAITTHLGHSNYVILKYLSESKYVPKLIVIQKNKIRFLKLIILELCFFFKYFESNIDLGNEKISRLLLMNTPYFRIKKLKKLFPNTEILETYDINQDQKIVSKLSNCSLLIVSGGKILKSNVFDVPHLGTVNIHNTLLPKFRGSGNVEEILTKLRCYKENGITIHSIDSGIDSGDILLQKEVHITQDNYKLSKYYNTLASYEILICFLEYVVKNKKVPNGIKQEQDSIVYLNQISL